MYYLRLAIPDRVRELNSGLPKELKRSTLLAGKRAALAKAGQMCVDFVASLKLPEDGNMLVIDTPHTQTFTIEYVDGAVTARTLPHAAPETLLLVGRIMNHVMNQMVARVTWQSADGISVRPSAGFEDGDIAPAGQAGPSTLSAPSTSVCASAMPTAHSPPPVTVPLRPVPVPANGRPIWLSEAIQLWRKHDGISFSNETWVHSYQSTFRIFRELLGNERRDHVQDDGSLIPSQLDRRIDTLTR